MDASRGASLLGGLMATSPAHFRGACSSLGHWKVQRLSPLSAWARTRDGLVSRARQLSRDDISCSFGHPRLSSQPGYLVTRDSGATSLQALRVVVQGGGGAKKVSQRPTHEAARRRRGGANVRAWIRSLSRKWRERIDSTAFLEANRCLASDTGRASRTRDGWRRMN